MNFSGLKGWLVTKAYDHFGVLPPQSVQSEMEAQGWEFRIIERGMPSEFGADVKYAIIPPPPKNDPS